jgi:PhzF family phenazine biosynthesis protein
MVRSFTPAEFEVVGAGHNLLGAVCLALIKGWDIFKHQDGPHSVIIANTRIPLQVTQHGGLPYVAMKQQPARIITELPAGLVAKVIGLNLKDLELNNWKINVVETEVAHLMVPVKDLDTLQRAVPDKALLKQLSAKFQFEGFYLFTTNGQDDCCVAEARFFNPGIGIDEDPATGTAAGPLAGYLEKLGHIKQGQDYRILQGTAVKHPSSIHIKVEENGIWVSGSSVIVMEGTIYL